MNILCFATTPLPDLTFWVAVTGLLGFGAGCLIAGIAWIVKAVRAVDKWDRAAKLTEDLEDRVEALEHHECTPRRSNRP